MNGIEPFLVRARVPADGTSVAGAVLRGGVFDVVADAGAAAFEGVEEPELFHTIPSQSWRVGCVPGEGRGGRGVM